MKKPIKNRLLGSLLGLSLLLTANLHAESSFPIGEDTHLFAKPEQPIWQTSFGKESPLLESSLVFHTYGNEKPLALKLLRSEKAEHREVSYYQASGPTGITVSMSREKEGYLQVQVEVSHQGKEALLLEPELTTRFLKDGYQWFDGFAEHQQANQREDICGSLPFAAIYNREHGLALGLSPNDLVSHFKSKVSEKDGQPQLSFSSRMVIEPGKTETRRFVFFSFRPDYGYLNAIGEYQHFFADTFQAQPDIHPETDGPLIGGLLWRTQNARYLGKNPQINTKVTDVVRWMGGGWEWCYAGFGYRPGDWLCTEEQTGHWMMPTKSEPVAFTEHFKMSAADFLKQHFDAYQRIKAFGAASMMYIIPNYCEEQLAMERYADSIYRDQQNQTRSAGPPWVVQHDRSLQMYPYGNSFGDYTLEAIKTIVERNEIDGFAFDCIDRARYPYRGPGLERSPGKAYDDDGQVYVNSEIAHAKFGEAVHALKRNGRTMALTGNIRGDTGSYLAATVLDAALIEHSPWDERPLALNVRYLLGRKSITYLRGFGRLPQVTERKEGDLVEMLDTLTSFTVLQSLRLGIYPNFRYVIGNPKLIYYMSVFNTLFRDYQWNPVPAATVPERLWVTRYGYGTQGVLYVGNSTSDASKGDVKTASSYFKAASMAWVDFEGRLPVTNRVNGTETSFPINLPRGEALLLQAGLYSDQPFEGEITSRRTRLAGKGHRDTWTLSATAAHPWFVTQVPGHTVTTIKLNGQPLDFEVSQNQCRLTLAPGKNVLEVDYQQEIQLSGPERLVNTPFLTEDKAAHFSIQIPADTPGYQHQAKKLISFFSNYLLGMAGPEQLLSIPVVVKGNPAPTEGVVVILDEANVRPGEPNITLEGATVTVKGNDPNEVAKGVDLLLNTLQERYPYYGYLQVGDKAIPADHRALEPTLFQQNTSHSHLPWKQ